MTSKACPSLYLWTLALLGLTLALLGLLTGFAVPADASDFKSCRTNSDCQANESCSIAKLCCVDNDGDGHLAAACGGDDCDDGNANRFPGNPEQCEADNIDEDCDPSTFGTKDDDGDGFVDGRCCNVSDGIQRCGTDCNDNEAAIGPNSMVCNGRDVAVCQNNGQYRTIGCMWGMACITQPNGTGLCGVEPAGYETPKKFAAPAQKPLPRLQDLLKKNEQVVPRVNPALRNRIRVPVTLPPPPPANESARDESKTQPDAREPGPERPN